MQSLRRLLSRAFSLPPDLPSFLSTWPLSAVPDGAAPDGRLKDSGPLRAAAVLVGITEAAAPGVLLTLRADSLSRHAGQVSFPGGRIDPEDATPEDAALREAWEEIGLHRRDVTLLGRLDPLLTGTGFLVTPVAGLVRPGLVYTAAPLEVASVFELPLSLLLDPRAPRREWREVRGQKRGTWVWPHDEHVIWGATAAILMDLSARLCHAAALLAQEDAMGDAVMRDQGGPDQDSPDQDSPDQDDPDQDRRSAAPDAAARLPPELPDDPSSSVAAASGAP